jgi:hypothetical protein
MSKNTHERRLSTTERTKKSIADLAPKQWGNDPTELKLVWLSVLETFKNAPDTRRERIARQLVIDEIARLRQLEIEAGVK